MIENILLAVSGSGNAEEMLKTLMELPSLQRTKITVLHVVPPQTTAETMTQKWEEGGKILANTIQSLRLNPTLISSVLRQGEPKDVVGQVAQEIDADLVIMGSRGLKRLESILANSVSQYVFQLSSRPMLLVKDDIYVKRVKRIMVAIDGSEAAKTCLNLALFFLKDVQSTIELILVNINTEWLGKRSEDVPNLKPESNPALAEAAAIARKYGVEPRCILSSGSEGQQGYLTSTGRLGQEICRLANDWNADILLMGSPDRRPSIAKSFVDLDRLFGSSLSDYVRVNASCPVLLARTSSD
ncbi:universal stress protein [Mastigocoleus testarum]|uniref:Universal stress protein UspA n=1 Tax=Mastigocoleus testarum BC008 TaxID=371196 RepID=A0A0V7ZXH7_9CYAN|nr:universal stress protein [Mastigocoleus testarum]KST69274.1 universal stress protein UspA [Mastigocoleus testarum BC008]